MPTMFLQAALSRLEPISRIQRYRTRALGALSLSVVMAMGVAGVQADQDKKGGQATRASTSERSNSEHVNTPATRAQVWELTQTEWDRYQQLMQGVRGSVSPATLSPIEVLGIHARTEVEREDYARRWARIMRDDAERILSFQRAYDAAGRELFASEPLIGVAGVPANATEAIRAGDRLILVVTQQCANCDRLTERLLAQIESLAGLDIYMLDTADSAAEHLREWAASRGVLPEWVRSRRVTLNVEPGGRTQLYRIGEKLPKILRRRNGSADVVTDLAF